MAPTEVIRTRSIPNVLDIGACTNCDVVVVLRTKVLVGLYSPCVFVVSDVNTKVDVEYGALE